MAIRFLRTPTNVDHYRYRTKLDGRNYFVEVHAFKADPLDPSILRYTLTLEDAAGAVLFAGRRAVIDRDVLEPVRYLEGMPPGRLIFRDAEGSGVPPGAGELGSRVLLTYEEAS